MLALGAALLREPSKQGFTVTPRTDAVKPHPAQSKRDWLEGGATLHRSQLKFVVHADVVALIEVPEPADQIASAQDPLVTQRLEHVSPHEGLGR
jgi:hypothetical protein